MIILKYVFGIFLVLPIFGFDYNELEIFDLVEEVNSNFYEVLKITADASSTEIRRAYRKRSLVLHPDKNKEDGAEEKFRQMASIYEVLKDKEKRKIYDHVLEFGLPNWKQPVYYYRHVRKLGLLETSILVFVIFSFVHYVCIWAMFFEKKFVLYENLKDKYNQKKSRKKQKEQDEMYELELKQGNDLIHKPNYTDILPVRYTILIYKVSKSLPQRFEDYKRRKQLEEEELLKQVEKLEQEIAEIKQDTQKRQYVHVPAEFADSASTPVNYSSAADEVGDQLQRLQQQQIEDINDTKKRKAGTEWSDEDFNNLSKAMTKLPGGTVKRWEKISDMVGRPLHEVTAKSKQIRAGYAPVSKTMGTKIANTEEKQVEDVVMTQRFDDSSSSVNNKSSDKKKVTFKEVLAVNVIWSQDEQKLFEKSLSKYSKGTPDRWDRIAECIEAKNKDDCLARFKYLADLIKKKKKQKTA